MIESTGYVIDVKTLLADFPEILETVEEYYPPGPFEDRLDYQCSWCIPADHILLDVSDFICEQLGEDADIEVVGDWLGDFAVDCPFEYGEAYVVFDTDQNFAKLIEFMRAHNIPQEALTFQKWSCRGSDCP